MVKRIYVTLSLLGLYLVKHYFGFLDRCQTTFKNAGYFQRNKHLIAIFNYEQHYLGQKLRPTNLKGVVKDHNRPLPNHVAFILDGNGRWAEKRGLPRSAGHVEGAKRAEEIVVACRKMKIPYVTLYALSTENWGRPAAEINQIFELMEKMVRNNAEELQRQGILLRVIGQRHRLPSSFRDLLNSIEKQENALAPDLTQCTQVCLAVSYGGRDDIISATKNLIQLSDSGDLNVEDINESLIQQHLSTGKLGIPDPDIIIRTSGETRLSNFFLWQAAYSEIQIVDKLWPDYGEIDLNSSIEWFFKKERRFGVLVDDLT